MSKLLTVCVPSYNAERFLSELLPTLTFSEDLEVIVVNDGSKDNTINIAKEFAEKYPTIIKYIDKENGGHGSGINEASKIATGLYFKCLDADDFFDQEGIEHLLDKIRTLDVLPDLFLADYISNYEDKSKNQTISIKRYMPKLEEVIKVEDIKKFRLADYAMMHMLFVKTSLIQNPQIHLIQKCFYEDNEFVLNCFKVINTVYYLEKPIYLYTLGNASQSTSLGNMVKNYNHAFRVLNACFKDVSSSEYKAMSKNKRRFVFHELFIITMLTYTYAYIGKGREKHLQFKQIFKDLKKNDKELYKMIMRTIFFVPYRILPSFLRHFIVFNSYKTFIKKRGWNY